MDLNTTNQIETAGPVAAAERIKTIDIVHGVALLGILMMNIPDFTPLVGVQKTSSF